ncbi:MAG: hypothetical protein LBV41_08770 [Cytophagaceae bacterium]|jgi:hypothetical protein|nr:hypothetical protein [Cytophagaceae bacterium]
MFLSLQLIFLNLSKILRTVYTTHSNCISFSIPDKYIGAELEILIFPVCQVLTSGAEKNMPEIDTSFGAWADMGETTE